jgi:glutamine synthetase
MASDGKVPLIAEYVWLSGKNTHHDIRSKCKTLYVTPADAKLPPTELLKKGVFPVWNFDGSSTGQAKGHNTEIVIKPVAAWPHPFGKDIPTVAVLAECYLPGTDEPTPDNTRYVARSVFDADTKNQKPWFGMEQEYVLVSTKTGKPLGWPDRGFPAPQGPYYCATGPVAYGRNIAMGHYEKCLKMGLKISGTNAEVMPGQWEYQVGPCEGIEMGDSLVMSRWCYLRLLEDIGVFGLDLDVNFEVKPIKGDWNGSGLHTNFSTEAMRKPGGLAVIKESVKRLEKTVKNDMPFYSQFNNERMTGHHETSSWKEFTWGVGTRHTSVRIGNDVEAQGFGYYEDRRPGADADPYLLSAAVFSSSCDVPAPKLLAKLPEYTREWMKF